MKKIILSIVILAALVACSKDTLVITKVKDSLTQIENYGVPYFLPRTSFEIEVEVTTDYFFPGPYQRFAEKFLSIIDAPSQRERSSFITDINIKQTFEPDPDAAYLIINDFDNTYHFSYNSILLSVNTKPEMYGICKSKTINTIPNFIQREVHFPDMTIESNFTNILDTTYRIVEVDSVFQKIPVYNTVMTRKTTEQKAEEAAEFIIDLRKARFFILHGDMEMIPEEGSMTQMLQKLDEIEQQYLELFIGKTVSITNSYVFRYTPEKEKTNEKKTMFYLCDEFGISQLESRDRLPIILNYNSIETTKNFNRFLTIQRSIDSEAKGLYYRIPGMALITIEKDEEIISQKKAVVPQAGEISNISKGLMNNDNFKIKFHPEYGSILRVN